MRLKIRHVTTYNYASAGRYAIQRLRLTARANAAQTVEEWRIEAPGIDQAASYTDGFGNITHLVTQDPPLETLSIVAEGVVVTKDTGGVTGRPPEAANPASFLRSTASTEASPAIRKIARNARGDDRLALLHSLMAVIGDHMSFDTDSSHAGTSAADAFAAGFGVCQDFTHIFCAAARTLEVPARYVTGYLRLDDEVPSVAHHAWAEAFVPELGWVGFDVANGICPTENYVRLACGLDARAAAPIVGLHRQAGEETLSVDVVVEQQQQ
ncbi:transglutaminase-like putative cysteine protease [Rhodopseudomonas julia]|uniref:Transglutaminase-like putative cysteine protease n=1 Tax=Rhodopseudomonas julia TaxID=200617 RepID=A0ABU0CBJ0_9BRAD|nr:transglutaminase family protein [Rhodopseudomonas julia]MDQ0327548.1 transglutaminase-like putative cysteine protease [Rhodopseudomonas julia]